MIKIMIFFHHSSINLATGCDDRRIQKAQLCLENGNTLKTYLYVFISTPITVRISVSVSLSQCLWFPNARQHVESSDDGVSGLGTPLAERHSVFQYIPLL